MFKVLGNKLYVGFVPNIVTKNVKEIYKLAIKKKLLTSTEGLGTVNGIQTTNILKLFDFNTNQILMTITNEYIKQYYRKLLSFNFEIYHLHMIKYKDGYQIKHNHSGNEDHSFILYLNNSTGSTRFYNDVEPFDIEPEINKIVFFNSSVEHEGLPAKNKFVLVGGIRVNKEWSF